METVYIETTIVSYLVARPGRDLVLAAHQWNCRHLANPHLQKKLRAFMAARGLVLPEICTPIELAR